MVATSPGALVLGAALPDGWPFWIRTVVSVSAVVGGLLVQDADRALPRPMPLLLAIGALGVYLCVPDTEAPKALLGALLAGAVIGLVPRLRASLGVTMVTGLFVWVVGVGGLGRPGSVVGGIACLGVLVLISVVRWTATAPAHVTALVVTQCARGRVRRPGRGLRGVGLVGRRPVRSGVRRRSTRAGARRSGPRPSRRADS